MYARVALVFLTVAAASCGTGGGERDEVPSALAPQDAENGIYDAGAACAHSACAVGAKLAKSCDGCGSQVCASDGYC